MSSINALDKGENMATKSPGVYFQEYDNTAYTNPKSVSGTTVCIVGYAKKGPIDEPTIITSWKDFTSTFGKPISGYYSALAVYNVIASGGTVLFVRVADNTASPSAYVIKNAADAVNGKAVFDRATNNIPVGTSGYNKGTIFGAKIAANEAFKNFYVRSPDGPLTLTSVLTQLVAQKDATPASYEGKLNRSFTISTPLSFKVAIKKNDDGEYITSMKDVYLQGTYTPSTFVDAVNSAINKGSNASCKITLSGSKEGSSAIDPKAALNLEGIKNFKVVRDGATYKTSITLENDDTIETLVGKLNTALNTTYNIACFYQIVDSVVELVFVDFGGMTSISIETFKADEISDYVIYENNEVTDIKALFLGTTDGGITDWAIVSDITGLVSEDNFTLYGSKKEDVTNVAISNDFTVTYDSNIGSIIFVSTETGVDSAISVIKGTNGDFLFDTKNGVVSKIYTFDGQKEFNADIARSGKQIYIESGNLEAPTIENIDGFSSLLTIMKEPNDSKSAGYTQVEGTSTVLASSQDMILVKTRENGSATNNIVVEFSKATSPIDGTVSWKLEVYVDGVLTETYDDISIDYEDVDNRFDTIINESKDNGGSAYITMEVYKNDFTSTDVNIKTGKFYLGIENEKGEVAKETDTDFDDVNNYDYAVGTDGIPEGGGSDLFEDVMAVGTSKLANKDLYDFHVLIAPDDITQATQTAQIALCEDRDDCMTIIDPPIGLDVDGVISWHNGKGYGRSVAPTSNFATTYWPWCKIQDPVDTTNGYKNVWAMPSVIMAAQYVKVDRAAGSWYAPAGDTNGLLSVIDIEQYPNKLDRDNMYVVYNRINPLVKFNNGNVYAYGEKTLQRTNSVLTKIHTRRMLIQIKKSCKTALKGYTFMPNTTEYLAKISSDVSAILEQFKAGGGLKAYKVICDETNNPTEVRQQDIVNVDAILVPEGTIEQINISLTLNKSEKTVAAN